MRPGPLATGTLLLVSAGAQAAAIGTGLFNATPHIHGRVAKGEAQEVRRDFTEPLTKPLSIAIHPLSDPVEVATIGNWLMERQPAVHLKGSCVGTCARTVLLSGAVQRIEPGTVIALGGMAEFPAIVKTQIEAGELFIDGDERSQVSRASFMKHFEPAMEQATRLRALLHNQAKQAEGALAFVAALTQGWRVQRLSFTKEQFDMDFTVPSSPCLWWVPDTAGLRQLGLDVTSYEPVSRNTAAKLLKVPEGLIYVGPAWSHLPEQPLCEGARNFTFPVLP